MCRKLLLKKYINVFYWIQGIEVWSGCWHGGQRHWLETQFLLSARDQSSSSPNFLYFIFAKTVLIIYEKLLALDWCRLCNILLYFYVLIQEGGICLVSVKLWRYDS